MKKKKNNLRKAEEKGGGPNQEGGGCWHRNISAGSKWTGRSRNGATYSSPNHGTTEPRHQRDKQTERKRGGRQRGGICLQNINGSFQVKNEYMTFAEDKGAWLQIGKEKNNYSKQQLKGNIINWMYLDSHLTSFAIYSLESMSTWHLKHFVHNRNRDLQN